MRFVFEWGFDSKEGKATEMQRWLQANEEKLALESPQGCKYLGTYAAVLTSEKTAGNTRMLFELENYAAQDAFSETMKQGGPFARMLDELMSYVDQRNEANWSQSLLRKVTDAAIWAE
jgi:hypothetical protein